MISSARSAKRGLKVFVGGPFSLAIVRGDVSADFDETLRRSIERVHDAIRDAGAFLFSAHIEENYGEKTDVSQIVSRDYGWLRECDVYIALLPLDASCSPYRTDGTFVECGIAIGLGKPVVLVVQEIDHPKQSIFVRNLGRLHSVSILNWDQSMEDLPRALGPFLAL